MNFNFCKNRLIYLNAEEGGVLRGVSISDIFKRRGNGVFFAEFGSYQLSKIKLSAHCEKPRGVRSSNSALKKKGYEKKKTPQTLRLNKKVTPREQIPQRNSV